MIIPPGTRVRVTRSVIQYVWVKAVEGQEGKVINVSSLHSKPGLEMSWVRLDGTSNQVDPDLIPNAILEVIE